MRILSARTCLWLSIGWIAHGFIYAEQLMRWNEDAGRPVRYVDALTYSLGGYTLWIPMSMLLVWLVERHPIRRGDIVRALVVQGLGIAAIILGKAVYVVLTNGFFGWYATLPPFAEILVTSVRNNLLTGVLVIAAAHGVLLYQRTRQHDLLIAELRSRLTSARLEALSAQLNPHFLFNTLNTIAEQVHRDPHGADRMLVGLAALLRRSLYQSSEQETRLREELDLLAHYLDIEGVRLGPRLRVEWEIDPNCTEAYVPALILQPIAENAIIHAIARRREPGRVRIVARREADRLRLEIEDDGASTPPRPGHGIGLSNTRARLECIHGDRFSLDLRHDPETNGTCASLILPFSTTRTLPVREGVAAPPPAGASPTTTEART